MKEFTLDWNKYLDCAINAVSEGCVLLKNDNDTLPLPAKAKVSVFGRIALHYYKSGTGSGGMVNVSKVVDGLNTPFGHDDIHNWQPVQCCCKCAKLTAPGGAIRHFL
jgi:hypothetical protein